MNVHDAKPNDSLLVSLSPSASRYTLVVKTTAIFGVNVVTVTVQCEAVARTVV